MKAIILAAGKGTRLRPLTLEIPKSMVEVYGKSLLEHNMEKLVRYVDEFIIVVKYKQEVIKDYFWDTYQWVPISYHEQGEKVGTAGALEWIHIKWDCLILASDTIYRQEDIDRLISHNWYVFLVQEVENPEKYGIMEVNESGNITLMTEKPEQYIWNLASLFYLKVNSEMLSLAGQVWISERWEYELTWAINNFVTKFPVHALKIKHHFIDITSIEDLERANTLKKPELWKTQYLESIWNYELHLGIPQTGIQEIVDYSLDTSDTALREGTSDWKKRFISVENLSLWYADTDRYPFTLLSSDGVVAGLWWWRPAKSPNITEVLDQKLYDTMTRNSSNTHTSGIRIYPFARWERLASPFMKACEKYYTYIFDDVYMSDDVGAENVPSQKAFERLWYRKVWYGKNINNSPESGKQRFVYMKKF